MFPCRSTEQIIGLTLALLLMGASLLGSLLHLLPGAALIFLTALGHRLYFGPAGASTWVLATVAGVGLVAMLIDFLATVVGARKLGATRRGMWGAVIGALAGLFFGLPGIFLGPFTGAFLLEQLGGRPAKEAAKAGLGALLGLAAGAVGQFVCGLVMIGMFTLSVCLNAGGVSV